VKIVVQFEKQLPYCLANDSPFFFLLAVHMLDQLSSKEDTSIAVLNKGIVTIGR
jgi:hypothetical protein